MLQASESTFVERLPLGGRSINLTMTRDGVLTSTIEGEYYTTIRPSSIAFLRRTVHSDYPIGWV